MKIAVISDIHADAYGNITFPAEALAEVLNKTDAEMVIIAGDISDNYINTFQFIEFFTSKCHLKPVFVPGNHDLWSTHHPNESIWNILDKYRQYDSCLVNRTLDLGNNWVIVGGCGWYDYSFADTRFTYDMLKTRFYQDRTWMDSRYVQLGMSDAEFHTRQIRELNDQLLQSKGKNVIFVTHMVNNPNMVVPSNMANWKKWSYFNGFLGSWELYRLTRYESVRYAVCGHVHFRKDLSEDGRKYLCRCLGSRSEFIKFGGEQDLKSQIEAALEIIEI